MCLFICHCLLTPKHLIPGIYYLFIFDAHSLNKSYLLFIINECILFIKTSGVLLSSQFKIRMHFPALALILFIFQCVRCLSPFFILSRQKQIFLVLISCFKCLFFERGKKYIKANSVI